MNARRSRSNGAPARLRFPLLPFLLSLGAAVLMLSGCPFNSQGTGTGGNGGQGQTCNVDGDCNDKEPCTADKCVESFCEHAAVDDGPLTTGQKAGDCKRIVCAKGESVDQDDDDDVPDDEKDCTLDSCLMGVASHVPKPLGTTCDNGLGNVGRCDAQGECKVPCTIATDCVADPPNPCVVPSCDTVEAVCTFPAVTDGTPTPGFAQTAGDCKVHICLAGVDSEQVDPSDVNVTATDCDVELCNGGTPDNSPVAQGSVCSTYQGTMSGHCDNAGACRQCAADADCGGRIDDCNFHACINFACGIGHDPDGTPIGAGLQTGGDCHTKRCDGAGNITDDIDDSDKPEDGNVCQDDICTNGVPSNVPHPGIQCGGTAGNPILCNAQGQCGCMADMDCTAPNTCGGGNPGTPLICGCTKKTCAQVGATCGSVTDGCFGTQNCNDSTVNGGETDVDCGGSGACANRCSAGKKCSITSDCTSGLSCVDGVCCTSACGGACQACSAAKKGGGTDGTCGAIANNTDPDNECTDDGAASCGNNGVCNGSGACRKYPAGTQCRVQNGNCDVAETCPGNGAPCPGDGYAPNSTVCRSSTGVCDPAENCTGSSPTCPANAWSPAVAVCRNANGVCDVPETCTGSSAACPSDGFAANTVECRAQNGVCDVAEKCTGSGPNCPNDGFAANTVECRAQNGVCDVAEKCSGSGPNCPNDGFASNSVQCRAQNGVCDVAEKCDGSGPNCPNDGFASNSVQCRAKNGDCDVAETCDGSNPTCPGNSFLPASTVCRAAVAGGCDIAENCTGSSAACPGDVVELAGTVCRTSAGDCDVAETCNGTNACPADAFLPSSTVCRNAVGLCDIAESCTGSSAACPANALKPNGATCRAAAGDCDIAETCNGTSTACPDDELKPSSTVCKAYADICDAPEYCSGLDVACPADGYVTLGSTDPPTCTGTKVCDGSGTGAAHCKLKGGQTCTTSAECASNNCSGSPLSCVGP